MLFARERTHLQTYKLTYTQIFIQYSGISSHSFGRSYTPGCLVAFDGVADAIPIAAEEMSIHLSPSGRRMVDDHT
jgi:hypothetical protein